MWRRRMSTLKWLTLLALSAVLACSGCASEPEPEPVAIPAKYDRSFDAAVAAAGDVGVEVRSADRTLGRILGEKAGVEVTIELQRQPNGTVKVEFSAPGSAETNPKLSEKWLSAYQRRMGR
jgi:hypothetical protein